MPGIQKRTTGEAKSKANPILGQQGKLQLGQTHINKKSRVILCLSYV